MRFHVLTLPHTSTTLEYCSCAYSTKVRRFCQMMMSLGHQVIHYGTAIDVPVTDHVTVIPEEIQQKYFGAVDWKKDFFPIEWNPNLPYWREANGNTITEIRKRIQPQDFICVIAGNCQKPVAEAFRENMSVEFGIGYEGVFSAYRVFESYAHMHYVYGLTKTLNGQSYDTVIPNYYDPSEFPFVEQKDDYYLFIGRLVTRKGIEVAVETCNRIGAKLIVAGQGAISHKAGEIIAKEITLRGNVEYVGTVDTKRRGELMSRAKAVFAPTQYIGPFEGVSVEAMMCGTPVITSDWGCFAETVQDGVTGFRVRTLGESMWAAGAVKNLNPQTIRDYAVRRFSMESVKHRYQDYFTRLLTLWGKGWYEEAYDPTEKRTLGKFV